VVSGDEYFDGATVFVGSDDGKLYAVNTTIMPALHTCQSRNGETCPLHDPSTWCCNLEVHHCVCAQWGTADEIRGICSGLPNGGIDCEECKTAPQCPAVPPVNPNVR
jgi:hypothetical protein